MLRESLERILREVPDDGLVLDIGGWAKPLPRADWVVDLAPYETRGLYGRESDDPERFSADTWVQRDICDREPLPFADDQFDFVVCSHTLEDVRDPVWVCAEIARIGKRGYIETPSRLEEQTYGIKGPWAGWSHHHWFVEVVDGGLEFIFKHHVIHGRESDHFPPGFDDGLSDAEKVETLWWEGSFVARERVITDPAELDAWLADFVSEELEKRGGRHRRWWQR